ncbi:hypothetical protein IE337_01190 [Weissella viridescens]|uniref:hypothetical protein n=1 Tax=Weissella viridescens TaxID=1629 RepID=UPI0017464CFD|nr:hypothetical protein [Weissella viridescens]QOD86261.1 hypothetical protein IE337_01190 [Weissella viridescens]WJI91389.1 hypothetical protein PWA48_01175 [Weissella viridescens]
MKLKKMDQYSFKDSFQIPIYVTNTLETFKKGNPIIDKETATNGFLIKNENETILEMDTIPLKSTGFVKDPDGWNSIPNEGAIKSSAEEGPWYGQSWDGKLLFVFNEYIRKSIDLKFLNASSPNFLSSWLIHEYRIVKTFSEEDKIVNAEIYIDYLYQYFLLKKGQDRIDLGKVDWDGEIFNASINKKTQDIEIDSKTYTKNEAVLQLDFENECAPGKVEEAAKHFRNLFQILMNEFVGINKILFNVGLSTYANDLSKQDFLSGLRVNENIRFNYHENNYIDLINNFNYMLNVYFKDEKIQSFIYSYVIIHQGKMSLRVAFLTLVSGVEVYFNNCTYESSGKTISDLKKKIRLLGIEENDAEVIKDARNYLIHGNHLDQYVGDDELRNYTQLLINHYHDRIIDDLTKDNLHKLGD